MTANLNLNGIPFRQDNLFNPSSIRIDGVQVLKQQLLTKQTPTLAGVISDERKNKGDARDIQLRQFRNLNGSTQYGSVPDNTDLNITNNLSVVVWAKNDNATLASFSILVGKYSFTGDQREWAIQINPDEKVLVVFGDPADGTFEGIWTSTSAIVPSSTASFGFTFASGNLKVYYNGTEIAGSLTSGTLPATLFNGTSPLLIGATDDTATTSYFDGDIYETRIYDTTILTASEMLDIHNRPTSHDLLGARLVGHYKLDNNASEDILDSSGNGNHGAWVNAPTKSTGGAVHSWANDVGYSERIDLNGTTDYVDITNALPDVQNLTKGRVSGKFKVASTGVFQQIFGASDKSDDSSDFGVRVLGTGVFHFLVRDAGVISLRWDSTDRYDDDKWHTFDITMTDSGSTILIDGVAGVGSYLTGNSSTVKWFADSLDLDSMTIGANEDDGGLEGFSDGSISDIVFYDSDATTVLHRWDGYGNTDTDWEDQVGVDNGTIVGSPSTISIPRDESDITNSVFGDILKYTGEVPYNALLKGGNCLSLDGTTQYVSTEIPSNFATDYVLFCEFSPSAITGTDSGKYRLLQTSAGISTKFGLAVDDSKVVMVYNTGSFLISTGVAVAINDNVKACVRKSGTTLQLYVNGVLIDNITATIGATDTEPIDIGSQNNTSDRFFAGKIWNIQVYDTALTQAQCEELTSTSEVVGITSYTHYPIANGAGTVIDDVSGNENHATTVNAPTWSTQDSYHYNLVEGFNKYMYFDGVANRVEMNTDVIPITGDFEVEIKAVYTGPSSPANNKYVFSQYEAMQTGRLICGINTSGQPFFGIESGAINGSSSWTDGQLHTLKVTRTGNTFEMFFDDVSQGTLVYSGNIYNDYFMIGDAFSISRFWTGTIYEAVIKDSNGDVISSYNGYGNTNADWVDQTGSNDGTVIGSPVNIRIPALTATTDVFGTTLRNSAGVYHNDAESTIDFTGGVASPVSVINAWETAWPFNTARVNPEFARTLTLDSVAHRADRFLAYKDALSGTNLTKVTNYTSTKEI